MRFGSGGVARLLAGVSGFLRSNIRFEDTASVTWSLTDDPANDEVEVRATATGAGGGYTTIQDEGTPQTARTTMNFVGAGVTASDSGSLTTITIPGGGAATFIVQKDDTNVDTAVGTLDFDGDAFEVTSSPAGEANVNVAYGYLTAFGE